MEAQADSRAKPTSSDIGFLPPLGKTNPPDPAHANIGHNMPRSTDQPTRRGPAQTGPTTYGGMATFNNDQPAIKFATSDAPRLATHGASAVGSGTYSGEMESRLLENERIQRTLVQNTLKFQNEMSETLRSHSNLLKDEQQTRRFGIPATMRGNRITSFFM